MSNFSAKAPATGLAGRSRASVSVLPVLICILVLAILYSLTIGRYDLSVRDVAYILIDNVHPMIIPYWEPVQEVVVEQVRLPRIMAAVIVGFGLSVSGAALQGLFRNPLVDPGIIGVTSGAGFGGTLAILLGLQGPLLLTMAFLFGIGSVFLVKLLSTVRGRTSMLTLVLAGVVISAFFSAAISIAKLLADPFQKLPAITYWLMGSIASSNYLDVLLVAAAVVPSAVMIYLLRFQINIMSLGEERARALGTKVVLVQWIILVASALISAGVVATSGIIGWVGLVIPHVARAFVGADHQRLLPVSGVIGAIYLLMVDNLARTVTTAEIPLGIITALIGVPVFAVILRRLHAKGGWSSD
ncbi:iron ABC transporter permease [Rhizobium sp. BK251]|uniref:FecCD family ABC transporter permease n=1 Tax=Rhizobium sp. BK251 TaxID=2512125 RepID=UPI0010496A83|nr:iron ABC transporter permease [Rhizobium sp. BK251]TCL64147.1 iron complex transport system permease protein [Rhizobium sp. BK251]